MMKEQPENNQQARLAALYEASSQLGSSLNLNEVLNQVMDSIIQLTGAERGYIVLYDDVSGDLRPVVARNVQQEEISGQALQVSRTVIERAVAGGKGIVTNNAQEDERFADQESVVGFKLRSIMCTPLRARNRMLGAVYLDNRMLNNAFQEADLELLQTFTNQAAIAIQNARLFTQTDQALARRVEEISLFQRIDQQLNKSLELRRVLRLALDWAISLTKADGGSIGLLETVEDGQEQVLRLLVSSAAAEDEAPRLVPTAHPVLGQVLQNNGSVVTHGVTAAQAIDGSAATVQLAVPIRRDEQIIGLITLESQQATALDSEDTAFVERLADRASVAINNAALYERIQAANKAKSDFISIISHELRLPMTSIRGYADLLNSGMAGALNDQQKQFLDVIRRNLARMSRLVSDLGDINRIEGGRMKFELKAFDIGDTIQDVAANLAESLESRQQSLALEIPQDLPAVYADPARIGQILSNLLSNAHKYTPDAGAITIRASQQPGCLAISVIDNGLGISAEDQAKLFTQFFRAESEEVRQQQGWGLGLSIVKKMTEAQGGEISFSSSLGEGSTFTFTIPLAS